MAYCQKCGAELSNGICPKCGLPADTVTIQTNLPVIHENACVKPRYNFWTLLLAGYPGMAFIVGLVIIIGFSIGDFKRGNHDMSFSSILSDVLIDLFVIVMAALCYLPGILMIRKRSPEGTVLKTTFSFIGKTIVFLLSWIVTLLGIFTVVGFFFSVWRIGLWASRPKWNDYTAFVGDEKIGVVKLADPFAYGSSAARYIYVDANGEYYRPFH